MIVGLFGFVLFSLASYWNMNDPDPEIWVTYYSLAAFFCLWSTMRKVPSVLVIGLQLFATYIVIKNDLIEIMKKELAERGINQLLPMLIGEGQGFDMKGAYVEEARELGGIIIVSLFMFNVLTSSKYINKAKKDQ